MLAKTEGASYSQHLHIPRTFLEMCTEAQPPLPVWRVWGNLECKVIIWLWHWAYWSALVLPYCIPWNSPLGICKIRGIISRWTLTKKHSILPRKERWISGLSANMSCFFSGWGMVLQAWKLGSRAESLPGRSSLPWWRQGETTMEGAEAGIGQSLRPRNKSNVCGHEGFSSG